MADEANAAAGLITGEQLEYVFNALYENAGGLSVDILLKLAGYYKWNTGKLLEAVCFYINCRQTVIRGEDLKAVCDAKYGKAYLTLFIAGILCNILIHIAVSARKGIITILCIMCFILCGFEHSIADAGYLIFNGSVVKWLVIVAGNTVGGILTEFLLKFKAGVPTETTFDF